MSDDDKNVHFTPREREVIACLLKGRRIKKIAQLLFVKPRGIDTHIHNIKLKLSCNSIDGIIDYITINKKEATFEPIYKDLLFESEKKDKLFACVNHIKKKYKNTKTTCSIDYSPGCNKKLVKFLEDNLKLAGINVVKANTREDREQIDKLIYLCTADRSKKLAKNEIEQKFIQQYKSLIFLNLEIDSSLNVEYLLKFSNKDIIDFNCDVKWYASFVLLLQNIFPQENLEDLVKQLEKTSQLRQNSDPDKTLLPLRPTIKLDSKYLKYPKISLISLLLIAASCFLLILSPLRNPYKHNQHQKIDKRLIRSDLFLPHSSVFMGRDALLKKIGNFLDHQTHLSSAVVFGMGGSGKTCLARSFARKHNSQVIWEINAESYESVAHSFASLAYALCKTKEDKDELELIQEGHNHEKKDFQLSYFVKSRLRECSSWLLIYDNVKEFKTIEAFYPFSEGSWGIGKIIVTTRNENLVKINCFERSNIISMPVLSRHEQESLFRKTLGKDYKIECDQQVLDKLLSKIAPFPLDISLAGHYLSNTKETLKQYLYKINSLSKKEEEPHDFFIDNLVGYEHTRFKIIETSLENLFRLNEGYRNLLSLLSLLDSQEVPVELIAFIARPDEIRKFLFELKKNSLISLEHNTQLNGPVITIHRSVQEAVYRLLENGKLNPEIKRSFVSQLTKMVHQVSNYYDFTMNFANSEMLQSLMRHSTSFVKRLSECDSEDKLFIMTNLGNLAKVLGRYSDCQKYFKEAVEQLKSDHPNFKKLKAELLFNLSYSERRLGNYLASKKCLLSALEYVQKSQHLKQSSLHTKLKLALGNLFWRTGCYHEGLELLLPLERKLRSSGSFNYLSILYLEIGRIYRSLGNFEKSKSYIEHAIIINEDQIKAPRVKINHFYGELGVTLYRMGELDKAKKIIEETYISQKNHFGEAHIHTAWYLSQLGRINSDQGRLKIAKLQLEKSYKIYRNHFNNDITDSKVGMILVSTYIKLGLYEQAKKIALDAYAVYKRHFQPDAIEVGRAAIVLGTLYAGLNDLSIAERYCNYGFQILQKNYGQQHSDTSFARLKLAKIYFLMGESKKATALINESIKFFSEAGLKKEAEKAKVLLAKMHYKKAMGSITCFW